MAPVAPPANLDGDPARHVLPAGSLLWRVHRADVAVNAFEKPSHRALGGRRFDGVVDDPYSCLYLSADPDTAVAEEFLPDLATTPAHDRILLDRRVAGRRLAGLRTGADLTLLRLVSALDLAAVRQDSWLVTAGPREYPLIREWASALRRLAPWAHGFVWTSSFDLPRTTMVLFEDRCSGTPLVPVEPPGAPTAQRATLAATLARYGVRTEPPPSTHARIFINFRQDTEHASRLLHNELSMRLGERAVFRAGDSIPFGVSFADVLVTAARKAEVMLSLIGRNWERLRDDTGALLLAKEDDWVRREILEAHQNRRLVIPVMVALRDRLDPRALPDVLAWLATLQYMTLPRDLNEADVASFVDKLFRRRPGLEDDDDLI